MLSGPSSAPHKPAPTQHYGSSTLGYLMFSEALVAVGQLLDLPHAQSVAAHRPDKLVDLTDRDAV
jgi:hypothetical protein